jgi:hypothetical protein
MKMSESQVAYHASLIRSQVKKKRSCLQCRKVFMSESCGRRYCFECSAKKQNYGAFAYVTL